MRFDEDHVRLNARQATTEDLLDRATVYRDSLEPRAMEIIEAELRGRGVGPQEIAAHETRRGTGLLRDANGQVIPCSFCTRPAVFEARAWHRLWGGPARVSALVSLLRAAPEIEANLARNRRLRFPVCSPHAESSEKCPDR
jgi:hypothetical protein